LKHGEKFQILKMLLAILSIYLYYLQKILKRFSKRICKNKTSGANVVQIVKEKKSNPFISSKIINWFNYK
jgi:flagellar biosynthesis/type III secretory pathway chaperone